MSVCVFMCVYVFVCVYVPMCVCVIRRNGNRQVSLWEAASMKDCVPLMLLKLLSYTIWQHFIANGI